jgi:RNA polymerase sigma factor (sigma-70 family)
MGVCDPEGIVETRNGGRGDSSTDDFRRLYLAEMSGLVRLAHLLTGSDVAADDIAHEAFLLVRERWATIERPGAYIRVVTVNLSRNWSRSNRRRIAREHRVATADIAEIAEIVDSHAYDELLELVDDLPFRQRAVLVARYWMDLSEADIADLVGCRPGTVKSLASRAMESLRMELS